MYSAWERIDFSFRVAEAPLKIFNRVELSKRVKLLAFSSELFNPAFSTYFSFLRSRIDSSFAVMLFRSILNNNQSREEVNIKVSWRVYILELDSVRYRESWRSILFERKSDRFVNRRR